jgi:restriction system protein
LARARQQCRWDGYRRIGDYHVGKYECDYVSPYTKSAKNVDAELMVLLQDWASDEVLRRPFLEVQRDLGHDPRRRTNINLTKLLKLHFNVDLADVYATNVFPFVKLGQMRDGIKRKDLVAAAEQFALPQIRIVAPRMAVCLGIATFNAIASGVGQPQATSVDLAIKSPFDVGKTQIWCQAHTGQQGQNNRNRGGEDRVAEDWSRMAAAFSNRRR